MEAREIIEWIEKVRKRDGSPEEWSEILDAINKFMESDKPENEKRLFYPLGYGESVGIICNGLACMRDCICARCKKKGDNIYSGSCEAYEVIPQEIWTARDGECQYYDRN